MLTFTEKKLCVFDMDETLIHCVDDIETQEPDVVLEINFEAEEETVYAGINIRPYIIECLEEAAKNFQVIVFTASHQTYADAILDYIDPEHQLITHRLLLLLGYWSSGMRGSVGIIIIITIITMVNIIRAKIIFEIVLNMIIIMIR